MEKTIIDIKKLYTGYGKKPILFDINLNVNNGEIVSIIGPNGAGKSTILKTIIGNIPFWKGDILFCGRSIKGNKIDQNIINGMSFCPQGNRVFENLTVLDNLQIGGFILKNELMKIRMEGVFELFPILKMRINQEAGTLSGGERQMLALGRALMLKPKIILLDEPSLGLAPNLVKDLFTRLVEINREFKISILIVEQKVKELLPLVDRVYSIKLGRNSFEGQPEELIKNNLKLKKLFI